MKAKNTMAATGVAAALMACGVLIAPAASAAELVGPGCADYAAMNPSGPASVQGMSMVPVTEAAANNPMLTTLTSALSGQLNPQVNLVETEIRVGHGFAEGGLAGKNLDVRGRE